VGELVFSADCRRFDVSLVLKLATCSAAGLAAMRAAGSENCWRVTGHLGTTTNSKLFETKTTTIEVHWARLEFYLNVWFMFDRGTAETNERSHYVDVHLGDAEMSYGALNRQYVYRNVERGIEYIIEGIDVDQHVVLNQHRSRSPITDQQVCHVCRTNILNVAPASVRTPTRRRRA